MNILNETFNDWLLALFPNEPFNIECLTGDAGFRQYYRLHFSSHSIIAVNAPPTKSNNEAFIAIACCLEQQSIHAPKVLHKNIEHGFFCLSDLGHRLLADINYDDQDVVFDYYKTAIDNLLKMLSISSVNNYQLPAYNKSFIATELDIFPQWLLKTHLSILLSDYEQEQLQTCFSLLIDNALSQPVAFMHRDYHSRNIMLAPDNNSELAIIDFQDAVIGPITYDIVSLLRDCYVVLPDKSIKELFDYFKTSFQQKFPEVIHNANPLTIEDRQWQEWFDLMGLQRHIKASGIFARLHHRDQKSGYLNDIPQTLSYIISVTKRYPELQFLHDLVEQTVLPAVLTKMTEKTGVL